MSKFRKSRVAELLQGFLASQLRLLHDSRLELVSITDVEVSPDLKVARVYWASSSENIDNISDALIDVTPVLKKHIARELDLRFVPELRFFRDMAIETGSRIDELLKKAGFDPQ